MIFNYNLIKKGNLKNFEIQKIQKFWIFLDLVFGFFGFGFDFWIFWTWIWIPKSKKSWILMSAGVIKRCN